MYGNRCEIIYSFLQFRPRNFSPAEPFSLHLHYQPLRRCEVFCHAEKG